MKKFFLLLILLCGNAFIMASEKPRRSNVDELDIRRRLLLEKIERKYGPSPIARALLVDVDLKDEKKLKAKL